MSLLKLLFRIIISGFLNLLINFPMGKIRSLSVLRHIQTIWPLFKLIPAEVPNVENSRR